MFEFDLEKFKKYDKPGPRYTSYPTAPHFRDDFTESDFVKEAAETNKGENLPDLSLYFHLPYCDTLCYFCGCNMIVTRNRERVSEYLKYIKKEISLMSGRISGKRKVSQLHWGGGTPTHLLPEEISGLASYITEIFGFKSDSENSCEIDPRGLTKEHLEALRSSGFNRISMGVQDFNEKVQKAVNRIQPAGLTEQVIQWIRELKFHSFNLDLMYGLPFQTIESFEATLEKVIELAPDRIAVFNYAYVPWVKKHMELINKDDLPSPDIKLAILKMTIEKLTGAGYVFIGMDHFAKPDDELAVAMREKKLYRNFQGYSTHAGSDLYAMGITAISQIGKIYSQNYKTEKEYFREIDAGRLPIAKGYELNADDILRKYVIMRLMCDFELDFPSIEEKFNIEFKEYFKWGLKGLEQFDADGLVSVNNNKIIVSEMGKLLIRNIAMNFDGYIERSEDTSRYSKTL
jgi:oxygen-independent coproporphyrinogen-3 oxidase